MFGLDHLLSPVETATFLESDYGTRACHIPGTESKFADLFGWEDLSNVVNDRSAFYAKMKLILDKAKLPDEQLESMDHWLRRGATLVVDSLDSLDPVVGRFAQTLAREVNTRVSINCYVSWTRHQGFDLHYDYHDVFVVHTAGRKAWKVFEPTVDAPIEQQRAGPQSNPPLNGKPYLECELTAGDVLYVPRGHWHYAVASDPSVHLTVGLAPRSAIDLLQWLMLRLMNQDALLRRDFPLVRAAALGGERDDGSLEAHVEAVSARLREVLDPERLTPLMLEYCMLSNGIRRDFQFPLEATIGESITPQTCFAPEASQKFLVIGGGDGGSATVLARGHVLQLGSVPRPILQRCFEQPGRVTGAELLALSPGTPWETIRGFLQTMFERGLFRVCAD